MEMIPLDNEQLKIQRTVMKGREFSILCTLGGDMTMYYAWSFLVDFDDHSARYVMFETIPRKNFQSSFVWKEQGYDPQYEFEYKTIVQRPDLPPRIREELLSFQLFPTDRKGERL